MGIIVPAILPSSREDLEEKLSRLEDIVDEVQIDIVDGRYVSPPSWPYLSDDGKPFPEGEMLPHLARYRFEVDLMVTEPEWAAEAWIAAGASRVVVHARSTEYLATALKELEKKFGHDKGFAPGLLSFGLGVAIGDELSFIEPFLSRVDYVQLMGIARIGRQGEPFDARVLGKIEALRHRYPDITLQIDGGVSLSTAPDLLSAGVDRLVVGSVLWKAPDLGEELSKFKALTERYGIYE